MITKEMADKAIFTGLTAVCAWCEHWHNNADLHDTTACGKDCGGPASNRMFPRYSGPLAGNLIKVCFICGKESDAAVEMKDKGILGACQKHVETFKLMLARPGGKPPIVNERIIKVE